jgi:hypothetical protein
VGGLPGSGVRLLYQLSVITNRTKGEIAAFQISMPTKKKVRNKPKLNVDVVLRTNWTGET